MADVEEPEVGGEAAQHPEGGLDRVRALVDRAQFGRAHHGIVLPAQHSLDDPAHHEPRVSRLQDSAHGSARHHLAEGERLDRSGRVVHAPPHAGID
jgi:hypothetical protein